MTFEEYQEQAWTNHATDAATVASGFTTAMTLVETSAQIEQFMVLVTHVMGEHLGRWNDGIEILQQLQKHPKFVSGSETEKAGLRSIAILKLCADGSSKPDSFSVSDQIRILATAASALSSQDPLQAKVLLNRALEMAKSGIDQKDPANRALAVTGNNLACALEEKLDRNSDETELMILAAQTGRKYWELAGTWLHISKAEYRLAMTYLQAKDFNKALQHAQNSLRQRQEHKAGNVDMFYAYEGLAVVERARKNETAFQEATAQAQIYFAQLTSEEKTWCEPSLKSLNKNGARK